MDKEIAFKFGFERGQNPYNVEIYADGSARTRQRFYDGTDNKDKTFDNLEDAWDFHEGKWRMSSTQSSKSILLHIQPLMKERGMVRKWVVYRKWDVNRDTDGSVESKSIDTELGQYCICEAGGKFQATYNSRESSPYPSEEIGVFNKESGAMAYCEVDAHKKELGYGC